MKAIVYIPLFIIFSVQFMYAQHVSTVIPMETSSWSIPAKAIAKFETFDGRKTVLLNGKITVNDINFSNGTLEVDVYAKTARSFAGIIFRKEEGTVEEVYMRLHKSNQPDAVQYTPTYKHELAWQLYKEYQANVVFKNKGWNTLRIEVAQATAIVYINDEKVLFVDHLKTDHTKGAIGLFALFTNRFSNFKITHKDANHSGNNFKKEVTSASNIITNWELTEAFPYTENTFNFKNIEHKKYRTVHTEISGLLPISKYVEKPTSGNFEANKEVYSVVKTSINSTKERIQRFSFDYSDKIIVYINGEAIFYGNNAFRSKGKQYQGHIDLNANTLFLKLKKGKNTIHCVIIDKANGWGIIGKLD
ncbi:family 16 glycoside hydrolase [uncultured Kordia sp.]|uniref:family 16 glycoside hydrolase n=1 Tax=uncultured Kordia sp. TaxID=507699 RepID=UPI002639AE12|nr:family 16 glycoside hydrolase [uncultured Kordia sp.]